MNNSECPYFKEKLPSPLSDGFHEMPDTGDQTVVVEGTQVYQEDTSRYRIRSKAEPRYPQKVEFPVYDGDPDGHNLSIHINGMCTKTRTAVTNTCTEVFCKSENHKNCPCFRK